MIAGHMGKGREAMLVMRRLTLAVALFAGLALTFAPATGPRAADGGAPTYHLRVDGLACPFCAYGIEKRLIAVVGVVRTEIDLSAKEMLVHLERGVVLEEAVARRVVTSAGFTLEGFRVEGAAE